MAQRRTTSIRLRGCEHHARAARAATPLRSCRHAGPPRRARPLPRHRATHRRPEPVALPWVIERVKRPDRPRGAADVARRPSMPPRCTKRRPEPRAPWWRPSFGMVCIATYVLFVISMVTAGLTRA